MAIRVSNVTAQAFIDPNVILRSVVHDVELQQETAKRALNVYNVTFQALVPSIPSTGRSVEDVISLADDVIFLHAPLDREVPTNALELQQFVEATNFPQITDHLGLQQLALPGLYNGVAENSLSLSQSVHYCFGLSWEAYEIVDELILIQNQGFGVPLSVVDTLVLQDSAFVKEGLADQLDLQQFVSAGFGYMAQNSLQLSDTITSESDFLRQLVDENVCSHAFTYYILDPCKKKLYQRFEGEGPHPGVIPEERLQYESDFVLETLTGPKQQLVIRTPEPDDRDRLGFNRINRETRGGELGVFSDPIWPKVNTLLFTVVALKPDKIFALQDFLQDTLGQEILLQDWTGSIWRGVITTPGEAAVEDGEGWWTIPFEFEGSPYEGSANDQSLSIQDTASLAGSEWVRSVIDDLALDQEPDREFIPMSFASGSLAGQGSLTGEGYTAATGSGGLIGLGALSGQQLPEVIPTASAALIGVGQLSGIAEHEYIASAALNGIGELSGPGYAAYLAQGGLSAIGELIGSGYSSPAASGLLAGISSIEGEAITPPASGAGSLEGLGRLLASGYSEFIGPGSIEGVGRLQASAHSEQTADGFIDSVGQLLGVGRAAYIASADLSGIGELLGSGHSNNIASGSLFGVGSILGGQTLVPNQGGGQITGIGELQGGGYSSPAASGAIEGISHLLGESYLPAEGEADLSGAGRLAGTGHSEHTATGVVGGIGNLVGSGSVEPMASGSLAGPGQLAGHGYASPIAGSELAGVGELVAEGDGSEPLLWNLLSSVAATGNANGVTSSPIDTTGASLIVLHRGRYTGGGGDSISDSEGNTWTILTQRAAPNAVSRLAYCINPITSATHTFTNSGANTFPSITVLAFEFSATPTFDQQSGATTAGAISLSPGAITPSEDNALIVTGQCINTSQAQSLSSPFTLQHDILLTGGTNMGSSIGFHVQDTAAATNPSWSSASSIERAVTMAVFTV